MLSVKKSASIVCLYYDAEQTRAMAKQVPKTSKFMNKCKLYRQTSLGL